MLINQRLLGNILKFVNKSIKAEYDKIKTKNDANKCQILQITN